MKPTRYYAITDDGGHAAGDKRSIDALCTLDGWRIATHEEYLQAKRHARKLATEAAQKKDQNSDHH